jgi:hypothetical protein
MQAFSRNDEPGGRSREGFRKCVGNADAVDLESSARFVQCSARRGTQLVAVLSFG